MDAAIRFDDLQRSFGSQDVLTGLSFSVRPGEVYALLGRNGAGKTTAIRLLLGFLQPDGGRSEVLGADSRHLPPALRDRIGYVGEGPALYGWMRVADVLAFEHGTRSRFDLDRARRMVDRLALPGDRRVDALSRGSRAQLALAVAVAARPDALILDDPAAGLDAVVRRELLETLIDAIGEQGCAVLLCSHALPDVERVADRIGLLSGGRLLVDATVDDLKRRVERRRARTAAAVAPQVPGLLAARPVGQGFELTLLDHDRERQAALAGAVESLSPPETPSLEELFLELLGTAPARENESGKP
jgi:ABC-2 type transport system ATP-binding protein